MERGVSHFEHAFSNHEIVDDERNGDEHNGGRESEVEPSAGAVCNHAEHEDGITNDMSVGKELIAASSDNV